MDAWRCGRTVWAGHQGGGPGQAEHTRHFSRGRVNICKASIGNFEMKQSEAEMKRKQQESREVARVGVAVVSC